MPSMNLNVTINSAPETVFAVVSGRQSLRFESYCGMTKFADHDAYIAAAPEAFQPLLVQLRDQLAKALPDAEELIVYDMPAFGFGKTIIAGYAAFSKQCGIYVSKGAITTHSDDIDAAGLKATKAGVTFSPRKPIPDELVKKLALASREDLGL